MNKLNEIIQKKYRNVYFSICLISFIFYIGFSFKKYIWMDEAFTFALIRNPFQYIWIQTANDVHPPLYYFLVKILTMPFGYSLISVRLFSILPYMFIIAFGGYQYKKIFNEKVSILFMLLFMLCPFCMEHSYTARMYSLAAAFVFINGIYAYKVFNEYNNKLWIGFIIGGVGAAYTHYFAFVSICMIYFMLFVFIIFKKKFLIKGWLIATVISIILYLPWAKCFIDQLAYKVNNDYWIWPITIRTLFQYFNAIFGDKIKILAFFSALTYLIAIIYVIKSKDVKTRQAAICALSVPVFTILIGITVSYIVRPIFIIRYAVPAMPLMITFLALSVSIIDNSKIFAFIMTIVIFGGIADYVKLGIDSYSYRKDDLNDELLRDYQSCEAYIVDFDGYDPQSVLGYYVTDKPIYSDNTVPFTNMHKMTEFNSNDFNSLMILIDCDKSLSDEYLNKYKCEYIGKKSVTNNEKYEFDVYYLTKN